MNVDSIAFGVYLSTENADNDCMIELYDRTNESPISNTTLVSNTVKYDWEWVSTTINFIEDMPIGSFDLGIRLKSETEGTSVSCYLPLLMIYRK